MSRTPARSENAHKRKRFRPAAAHPCAAAATDGFPDMLYKNQKNLIFI